jgi:predicted nucleotidyltransferase
MKYSLDEIRAHICKAAKQLNAEQAWLFGSYARGDAHEDSDVDVLFVVKGSSQSRMQHMQQARRILRSWHIPKDIVIYDTDEFNDWQDVVGALCYKVKKEGVLFYEAQ